MNVPSRQPEPRAPVSRYERTWCRLIARDASRESPSGEFHGPPYVLIVREGEREIARLTYVGQQDAWRMFRVELRQITERAWTEALRRHRFWADDWVIDAGDGRPPVPMAMFCVAPTSDPCRKVGMQPFFCFRDEGEVGVSLWMRLCCWLRGRPLPKPLPRPPGARRPPVHRRGLGPKQFRADLRSHRAGVLASALGGVAHHVRDGRWAQQVLQAHVEHPDRGVRWQACSGLATIANDFDDLDWPALVAHLERGTRDPDAEVRAIAIQALADVYSYAPLGVLPARPQPPQPRDVQHDGERG